MILIARTVALKRNTETKVLNKRTKRPGTHSKNASKGGGGYKKVYKGQGRRG